MLDLLVLIGAIVVAIAAIVLAIWVAVVLGVIAFFAYIISDATGLSMPVLFVLGVIGVGLFLSPGRLVTSVASWRSASPGQPTWVSDVD